MRTFSFRPHFSCLVAVVAFVAAACSSASPSAAPAPKVTAPLSCTFAADAPHCPGAYEFSCTGEGDPDNGGLGPDGQTYAAVCTPGPADAKGGRSVVCCTGCRAGGDGCPDVLSAATYAPYVCRGSSRSNLRPNGQSCFAQAPASNGDLPECCLHDWPQDDTCEAFTGGCDGHSELVGCYTIDTSFECSVDHGAGACCFVGSCSKTTDVCAGGHGTRFTCDGGPMYEGATAFGACDVGVADIAHGNFDYCCVDVPQGAACQPDNTAFGCAGPRLFGFSCSGSATPSQQAPFLNCFAGAPGAAGSTRYCCAG